MIIASPVSCNDRYQELLIDYMWISHPKFMDVSIIDSSTMEGNRQAIM